MSPYPHQHFLEHILARHHFSRLKYKPPGMAHQSTARLDESGLNARQRPALYRLRQRKPSNEVAQVVGQDEQPQPHLVGHELVAG